MKIGTLISKGKHYEGAINTFLLNIAFTLEPNEKRNEKAPHFKAFDNDREIGYAYLETFESQDDGRVIEFFSIKIEEPGLPNDLYCKAYLRRNEAGVIQDMSIVWKRYKPKAA